MNQGSLIVVNTNRAEGDQPGGRSLVGEPGNLLPYGATTVPTISRTQSGQQLSVLYRTRWRCKSVSGNASRSATHDLNNVLFKKA